MSQNSTRRLAGLLLLIAAGLPLAAETKLESKVETKLETAGTVRDRDAVAEEDPAPVVTAHTITVGGRTLK